MRTLKVTGQVVALAAVAGLLGLLVWRLTHQSKPPKLGGLRRRSAAAPRRAAPSLSHRCAGSRSS
jgi:hypothetical protein